MKITSSDIRTLKPQSKRYVITLDKGLTLRVHPSGIKSFVVRLCKNGKITDLTIGRYPTMTLAQAQAKTRKLQQQSDIEPINGYTLGDAYSLWIHLKRGRIISYADEKRRLDRYVMNRLRNKQIDQITAPLVIQTVMQIERDGKLQTLKRVLMRLREILDLAVCAGYIPHNPISRISRIFPAPIVTPMPSVEWQELPAVMQILSSAPPRLQILFLFSICSMLRPGEIAQLRKSWISDKTLIIPADVMKMKRPHRVPLTDFMLRLVATEQKYSPHPRSDYIFAGRKSGTHISKQALTKWLHRSDLKGRLVTHGLRSIARSWLADQQFPFDVAETCLAHQIHNNVYAAYQRSDFLEIRRTIFQSWSDYIEDCANSAGILTKIPIPTAY